MRVLSSVSQPFTPKGELLLMMETFRQMVNECIRIGLEQKKTSMKSLCLACYPQLKKYEILSYYKLCAISRASGILSNYRKIIRKNEKKRKEGKYAKDPQIPYCTEPSLVNCYRIKVKDGKLHSPSIDPIPLNDYVLKRLSQATEIRSVVVSTRTISICISTEVEAIECTGMIGIDTNLENVSMADSDGYVKMYRMDEIAEAKQKYREVKSHFKRNDVRISEEVFGKYGKLQADKAQSEINKITARVVKHAKEKKLGIALENLKEIRKLYRKGNGQGKKYRARLNSWAFGEFQRQIEYKAKLNGLIVIKVNPRGTSAECSTCWSKMSPEENRMLYCTSCGMHMDRDVNASYNIMKGGLAKLFALRFNPYGQQNEAVVQERSEEGPNPESRLLEVNAELTPS